MQWFLLAVVSAVTYAAAEIIGKYVSDERSEPVFIGIIAAIFTTAVSFAYAGMEGLALPSDPRAFAGLCASALFVAVGIVTYYEGLKHSDVSEFGLLSRSRVLLLMIGGMVLFRERLTVVQTVGSVLVLYGIFLLSWEGGKFRFGKGAKFALVTAVLFGAGSLCDKSVIGFFTPRMYTFLNYLLTVGFMIPIAAARYVKGAALPHMRTVGILSVIGTLYGVSAYCLFAAYAGNGPVSLITVVSQLEIPLTVLWGILILNERTRMVRKLLAMAILVAGVVFVG